MHLVQDVPDWHLDVFMIVFFTDILVYSKNMKNIMEHFRLICEKLRKYKLFFKKSMCTL